MAVLTVSVEIDGTPYGPFNDGGAGGATEFDRVSFGAFLSGAPNDLEIRNITVGTAGFGSSDLFAPTLASTADFDSIVNPGTGLTVAGGILSVVNSGSDTYGLKAFSPQTDVFVQFDLKCAADMVATSNSDVQDIWDGSTLTQVSGLFFFHGDGTGSWDLDDGTGASFGTGPISNTWQTIRVRYTFGTPPPLEGCLLSLSASTITTLPGGTGTTTVTSAAVLPPGTPVTLSSSGEPAGVTTAFATNPIAENGGTSIATVTVGALVAPGSYPIDVHGLDGGGNVCDVTLTLDVVAPSGNIAVKERVPFN